MRGVGGLRLGNRELGGRARRRTLWCGVDDGLAQAEDGTTRKPGCAARRFETAGGWAQRFWRVSRALWCDADDGLAQAEDGTRRKPGCAARRFETAGGWALRLWGGRIGITRAENWPSPRKARRFENGGRCVATQGGRCRRVPGTAPDRLRCFNRQRRGAAGRERQRGLQLRSMRHCCRGGHSRS
jgi:hypothetical protein